MLTADDKRFFREHGPALRQLIPFLVLGILVPVWLWGFKLVDRAWFILGPVTWLLALGIKAAPVLIGMFYPKLSLDVRNTYLIVIGEGLLSAIAELGLTIAFFFYMSDDLSLRRILSFGLGIGFAEILFIAYLIVADIEDVTEELKRLNTKKFILWFQLLERMLALTAHMVLRAIIGIAMLYDNRIFYIVFAFLVFAFIDGWGGYVARKPDLLDRSVQKRIYLTLGAILLLPIAVFLSML
jgi:hypothetical protein